MYGRCVCMSVIVVARCFVWNICILLYNITCARRCTKILLQIYKQRRVARKTEPNWRGLAQATLARGTCASESDRRQVEEDFSPSLYTSCSACVYVYSGFEELYCIYTTAVRQAGGARRASQSRM